MKKYIKIENYAMKCRLYLSKSSQEKVKNAIKAVQLFYNSAIYDMTHNLVNTKEVTNENNETVHFPDFYAIRKADYINKLRKQDIRIAQCPAGAISAKGGIVDKNMQTMWLGQSKNKKNRPVESVKTPNYYSKKRPLTSITYQEYCSKFFVKDNKNVIYMDMTKHMGIAKIRGFNNDLRFDELNQKDFITYCNENKKKQLTITLSYDKLDNFYIVIKFTEVYKPIKNIERNEEIGIDVGATTAITTSDSKKYENKKYNSEAILKINKLQKRLSRQYGFSNVKFRKDYKEAKNNDSTLIPSKRYEKTQRQISKTYRTIANKKNTYNNQITTDVVQNNKLIGIESLDCKSMFSYKDKLKEEMTNMQRCYVKIKNKRLINSLRDSCMGEVLAMIKYKSQWYGTKCISINKWFASSQICSCCGINTGKKSLDIREWDCPHCGAHHDRDINAAKNILIEAKRIGVTV